MLTNKNINEIFQEVLIEKFKGILVRGDIKKVEGTSDIDIVMPKGDFINASSFFIEAMQHNNWKLISYRKIPYLISIVITNLDIYRLESLKIDFFDGVGWCGEVNKDFDSNFFSSNFNASFLSSTLTLSHKLSYAGHLSEKDINRIKCNINNAINFLKIDDLITEKIILKQQKLSYIKKWQLRYRLSGYKLSFFPFWIIRILKKIIIIKLLPIKSYQRMIFIVCKYSQVNVIKNQLISLYSSSGDQIQPEVTSNIFISNSERLNVKKITKLYLMIINKKIHSYNKNLFLLTNVSKKYLVPKILFKNFGKSIDLSSSSSDECLKKLINEVDIIISKHIKLSK